MKRVRPRRGLAGAVARVTGANFTRVGLAFVTAPILARTLGPVGRGELAAVFSVVAVSPAICELGVTSYLSRAWARRSEPLGVLLGSTLPIAALGSLAGVALAVPIAHLIGQGRATVVEFIEIGLCVMPLAVLGQTLSGIAVADQRWGMVSAAPVLNAAGSTLTLVVLSILGDLTVASAAITYIVWGIAGTTPFLSALRGSRPWRFSASIARAGRTFGLKSWLATIGNIGNNQLDQLLMAGLLTSRDLGLYALAATLSTVSNAFVGAASTVLTPRVAQGDFALGARTCRVVLTLVTLLGLAIGLASPVAVPVVFGQPFAAAIPPLIVLLAASVFYVPATVLAAALVAAGSPGATARGQLAGLILTVPGLIIFIPIAGVMGAAWVTLAAYFVTFGVELWAAKHVFNQPYRAFFLVTGSDLRALAALTKGRLTRA